MRRREFVKAASLVLIAGRASAEGRKHPVVGFLSVSSPEMTSRVQRPAFLRGLGEAGFVEGRNVSVEYVWADGYYDRLQPLAAELVRRRVDVIVAAGGTVAALAAKAATATVPIISVFGIDPVGAGLVASINRPSRNMTGVAQLMTAVEPKRLELLHEFLPQAKTIALLQNPARPQVEKQRRELLPIADRLGLILLVLEAAQDEQLAGVFEQARRGAEALLVAVDPYFLTRTPRLVELANVASLPTMYFFREFVLAGGLISYGSNLANAYLEVGRYAGKVLNGADPADLPIIQQSDKQELLINIKTAAALGLTIPPTLLARADEVIE